MRAAQHKNNSTDSAIHTASTLGEISRRSGLVSKTTLEDFKAEVWTLMAGMYKDILQEELEHPTQLHKKNVTDQLKDLKQKIQNVNTTLSKTISRLREEMQRKETEYQKEMKRKETEYQLEIERMQRDFAEAERETVHGYETTQRELRDEISRLKNPASAPPASDASKLPPLLHAPDHITIYDEFRGDVTFRVTKDTKTQASQVRVTWHNSIETEICNLSKLLTYKTSTQNVTTYSFLESNDTISFQIVVHGDAQLFNEWLLVHKNVIELCEDFTTHPSITNLGKQYHTENNLPPRPPRHEYTVRVPGL